MDAHFVFETGLTAAALAWCSTIIAAALYKLVGKSIMKVLKFGLLLSILCLAMGGAFALLTYAVYKVW